jgi:hypothetical protein
VYLPHLVEGDCAQDRAVREVRLELEFSQYETYEDKTREVYRPKGAIGIHHGGEDVREGALALLGVCVSCGLGSQESCKVLFPPS